MQPQPHGHWEADWQTNGAYGPIVRNLKPKDWIAQQSRDFRRSIAKQQDRMKRRGHRRPSYEGYPTFIQNAENPIISSYGKLLKSQERYSREEKRYFPIQEEYQEIVGNPYGRQPSHLLSQEDFDEIVQFRTAKLLPARKKALESVAVKLPDEEGLKRRQGMFNKWEKQARKTQMNTFYNTVLPLAEDALAKNNSSIVASKIVDPVILNNVVSYL